MNRQTVAQLKKLFRQNIKAVPGGPPVGTVGKNRAAGVLAALDALAENGVVATNEVVGGFKSVLFLNQEEAAAAGRAGDLSLDQIDSLTIVNGNLARTEFARNGVHDYRAAYDGSPDPSFLGYLDGDGVKRPEHFGQYGGLAPLKWYPVNSPAATVPAYPMLPAGYVFTDGELVRAFVPDATTEQFFAAIGPGPKPAPTSAAGDSNYRKVNEADVPTTGGDGYTKPETDALLLPLQAAPFELRYQATAGAVRQGFATLREALAAAPLLVPSTVLVWPGRADLGGESGHLMPGGDTGVVRKNITLWLAGGTVLKFPSNGKILVNGFGDFSSPAASLTITGPGKLIGQVFVAGNLNTTRLLINCRHDGYVYVNYTNLNGKTNADELRVGPAGYVTNTGSSGGYFKLLTGYVGFYGGNAVNLHFDRCRAELPTLVERQLSAPTDAPTLTISSALLVPSVTGDVAGVPTTYVSATPGGGGGGTGLETVNTYALTADKRTAVADALIAQVAQGGQAWLLEPDGNFLGQVIVDNRTGTDRSIITCHQQANPTTGATEFCWYRSVVQ